MKEQDIKVLTPVTCPHCQKTIVVEFTTSAPQLSDIYTPEIIEAAKVEAVKQIELLLVPEEISKPVIDWVQDQNTIFGPNDIPEIIKQLKKQGDDSIEEDNT